MSAPNRNRDTGGLIVARGWSPSLKARIEVGVSRDGHSKVARPESSDSHKEINGPLRQ